MQIPSPSYINTEHELACLEEFDPYDYFMDAEYGDDEYWEHGRVPAGEASGAQKRKRAPVVPPKQADKKRKKSSNPNVLFVPIAERVRQRDRTPTDPKTLTSFALITDWRTRYAGTTGELAEKAMPADMKRAAESKDDDTSPQPPRHIDAMIIAGEDEEEREDEDTDQAEADGAEAEAHSERGDLQAQLASLDPETLKAILKQRLGDAGLDGMDEGAFMQTIAKMMSGDNDAEDAAGDLATSLLGQANDGKDSALTGWLSQQGVSLDAAGGEDDEDDEEDAIVVAQPNGTAGKKGFEGSPQDSAISVSRGSKRQMAMHGSSPSSAKKRSAPEEGEGASGSGKKRQRVVFEVNAGLAAVLTSKDDGESIAVASAAPNEEDEDSIAVAPAPTHERITSAENPGSEQLANGNDDEHDDSVTVTNSKKANAKSTRSNESTSRNQPDQSAEADDIDDEIQISSKSSSASATRSSRKRKAADDVDHVATEGSGARPKRQARKVTMPKGADDEPAGRSTRTARAKVAR